MKQNETTPFHWKPFSPKAKNYLANSETWINIAVGSIRSGKTITVLTRFIEFIIQSENEDFMIIGKTLKSLERNVVKPLRKMLTSLGIPFEENGYLNEIYFMGNTICLFGAGKKGDDEKIQGSTFGGALIDESTVITEDSFKMILSRNSLPNSCIFITCNPANPNHYLYTQYITNTDLLQRETVKVWTFELGDNYSLSTDYIENLKSSYPEDSLFYKRYILGQWVSGNGAIYPHFTDENIYTEDKPCSWFDYIEAGSDYGASSTTCWDWIGIKEYDDHNEYYIFDEGGHNAKEEGVSLTNSEIVDMIIKQQDKYGLNMWNTFYPSHDATSFETELVKNEDIVMNIQKYTPDLLECIGEIDNLFDKNYIHIHSRCEKTIECIQGYEWDGNAAKRGEDKPLKVDDHYADSIRAPIMNHLFNNGMIGFSMGV